MPRPEASFKLCDRLEACRVCGKEFKRSSMLSHAHSKHPIEFFNWRALRGGFGMSAFEHFRMVNLDKPLIRS